MNRCLWCNSSSGELRAVTLRDGKARRDAFVHAVHEESLVAWHARAVRETPRLVTIVAFMPLLVLPALGLAAMVGRASTFVVLGLVLVALSALMWRHPYPTPQTVQLLGVRRSVAVIRVITALVALGGGVVLAAGLVGLRS